MTARTSLMVLDHRPVVLDHSRQVRLLASIPRHIANLPLFWRVQILGWTAFLIFSLPLKTVFYGSIAHALWLTALREPIGFLVSSSLRPLYKRLNLRTDQPLLLAVWVLPISFLAAAIELLISLPIARLAGWSEGADPAFGPYIFRSLLFALWSFLYLGARSLLNARERLLALAQAETAARDAELLMLRAQVAPHFLFNAFNTILADLDANNTRLIPVVRGLSDYFRYSLTSRNDVFVTMGEEYDAILSYLTVEKARFHDSLEINCHLDPLLRSVPVPGIFLQPLVENALKYGHMTSPTPLKLRLAVTALPSHRAMVEVVNSGQWVEAPPDRTGPEVGGNGLGILRRRLELLYPNDHSLEIHPAFTDEEVMIRILLPTTPNPSDFHAPAHTGRHRR